MTHFAPLGLLVHVWALTQGVALGYHLVGLWPGIALPLCLWHGIALCGRHALWAFGPESHCVPRAGNRIVCRGPGIGLCAAGTELHGFGFVFCPKGASCECLGQRPR